MRKPFSEIFWRRVDRFPPVACRILARTEGPKPRALTAVEIATRSGLPVDTVHWLSRQTDWSGITVGDFKTFSKATGMDFADANQMRRANQYVQKRLLRKLSYLRKSEDWAMYKELLSRWSNARSTTSG